MRHSIHFRHHPASHWSASNPLLGVGEPGFESDTGRLKIGDGATHWNALGYFPRNGNTPVLQPVDDDLAAEAALVAQAIQAHKADLLGAHPQYVPLSVFNLAIANLQAQIDALAGKGSAPMNTDLPAISGDAVVGHALTVSQGAWTNAPTAFNYQWRLGSSNVPGATGNTYVPATVGIVTCVVTATNGVQATSAASLPVTVTGTDAAPTNTVPPVITGAPIAGSLLSCSTGGWANSPTSYAYQWLHDGIEIAGAVASTYQTGAADAGSIACVVIASNATGSSSASAPAVTVALAPTSSPSNPITFPLTGLRTFDVGPGQAYAEPDTVPWGSLVTGDVVNIHHRPTPYAWKIGLRGQGTQANPIVINGVTDASGNRPVFQLGGARTASGCNPGGSDNVFGPVPDYGESLGGIVIKRGNSDDYFTYKPQWIEIRNLEVRGASKGASYVTLAGGPVTFGSAAGIYVHVGRDILIENCVSTDNGFGIFAQAKDEMLSQAVERLTVRACRVFGNGVVGSWLEHNLYIQCANPLIEGNFIGQTRAGSAGSSYKSRSSGEIFRYNYVEASARACDWVHSEEQSNGISAQPDYGSDYAYGNIIVNDFGLPNGGAYAPLHYGGDNLGEQQPGQPVLVPALPYRKRLYFFNNTVINRDAAGAAFRIIVFDISLVPGTIEAWNNLFCCSGSSNFFWVGYAGTLNLRGNNLAFGALADARPEATPGQYAVNRLGSLLTADPRLVSLASYDYALDSASPAIDAAASPPGVPPNVLETNPIRYQPRMRANGLAPRTQLGAALELGAIEFDPAAGANTPPQSTAPPVISGDAVVGQTLSCSTGTWSGSPSSYAYQWIRSGVDVVGATGPTYPLSGADVGDVACRVTATSSGGSAAQVSNVVTVTAAAAPPVNTLLPSVSGGFVVGAVLTASPGVWTGAPTAFAYQWRRDGSNIDGATGGAYTLAQEDASTDIAVAVTATNVAGSTTATSAASHVPGPSADPDGSGVFNFAAVNGTTLAALSDKFQPPNFAADYECQSGNLQCIAGTGFYGAVVRFENNQGPAQQSTLVRVGAPFPSGGELGVYVQRGPNQGGYSAWFQGTNVQLRRQSAADAGAVYIAQIAHGIDWSAQATLRIAVAGGVLKVFANGVERLTYQDPDPLTGGFPGFYLVPGANVGDHKATSWTDQ